MLARERPAESRNDLRQLSHGCAKRRNPRRARQIEIDARMNASLAKVSIVRCDLEFVPLENPIEAAQERAEVSRRHGGVLRARPTARTPWDKRAGAKSRFANLPDRRLLASV